MISVREPGVSQFLRSEAIRHIGLLLSGSTLAQLVTVGLSPFISRLYRPNEFGEFGLYLAALSFLVVVSSLRYESAIVLPAKDEDGRKLVWLSLLILVAAIGIVTIAVVAAGLLGAEEYLGALGLDAMVWLPVGLLLAGSLQIATFWLVRRKRYQDIAQVTLARATVAGVGQIASAGLFIGAVGLIIGQIVGQVAAMAMLAAKSIRRGSVWIAACAPDVGDLKFAAQEHSDFPRYDLPRVVLNTMSQQAPVVMLAWMLTASAAGLYLMAFRLLILPVTIAGQSVRHVLLQKLSVARNRNGKLRPIVQRAVRTMALIGVLPAATLVFAGPAVFDYVLGDEWRIAGVYAAWMSPWLLLLFVKEAVIGLVPVLGLQRLLLIFELVGLPGRIAALLIGAVFLGDIGAVAGYALVGALMNGVLLFALFQRARQWDDRLEVAE